MHYLSQNLKYLRGQQGLTQAELALKLGVNRAVIGAYEEGRAEPRLDTLRHIARFFRVALDNLLEHDLSGGDVKQGVDVVGGNLRIISIAVDTSDDRERVTLVPVKAAAGYLRGYGDADYIGQLPNFELPLPELPADRTYRVFQVEGDSMLPVQPGSYVICEYVQDWRKIRNGQPHVLLTRDDGVVYKRVDNQLEKGLLRLVSDNSQYKPYTVKADQLLEVWKALGVISFGLDRQGEEAASEAGVGELLQVVQRLEARVEALEKSGK